MLYCIGAWIPTDGGVEAFRSGPNEGRERRVVLVRDILGEILRGRVELVHSPDRSPDLHRPRFFDQIKSLDPYGIRQRRKGGAWMDACPALASPVVIVMDD